MEDLWATPQTVFDALPSLPFRYELLRELTRAEVAVLSAIVYAARLRGWGEEFALPDARIADQTGYSLRHIRRIRAVLLKRGLFSHRRRSQHGVNYYSVDRSQAERILRMSQQSHRERVERIIARFDPSLHDLVRAFYLTTGYVPRRSWKTAMWLLKKCGVDAEWLRRLIHYMHERGYTPKHPSFAVRYAMRDRAERRRRAWIKRRLARGLPLPQMSRAEKKARKKAREEQYKRKRYRYAYDPVTCSYYVVEQLPPDAREDIYEDPLPMMKEEENRHGQERFYAIF